MTKSEAIQAMSEGKKVTHYNFTPEEWMTIENNMIVFEDGVKCSFFEFWKWRADPSWENDYSLYIE